MPKKTVVLFSVSAMFLLVLASFAPAKQLLSNQLPRIVFDGDSLTYGMGATRGHDYPSVAMRGVPSWLRWDSFGVSGQTLADMQRDAAQQIDHPYGGVPRKTLVAWGGVNDIFHGADAATVYERLVAYSQARKQAGWRVYVLTILPFGSSGKGSEAERTAVNKMIRTNWREFSDGLIDVAADGRIGDAGDELNAAYFNPDHIHLTDTGYSIIAEHVEHALAADRILPR